MGWGVCALFLVCLWLCLLMIVLGVMGDFFDAVLDALFYVLFCGFSVLYCGSVLIFVMFVVLCSCLLV